MLDTLLSALYSESGAVTVLDYAIILAAALICGAAFAEVYRRSDQCSKSFFVSLALLPTVVAVVILMVNGNIGAGVAVAGTFSLVRFRSAAGSAKEILAVFADMAIGLACGMGCAGVALIFTLVICAALLLYSKVGYGARKGGELSRILKVTLPEDLEYANIFDDIFERYTSSHKMTAVRTTNLGSLNRLTYEVVLRKEDTEKQMIDEIRCRNGNLEINICAEATRNEEL